MKDVCDLRELAAGTYSRARKEYQLLDKIDKPEHCRVTVHSAKYYLQANIQPSNPS